MDIVKIYTDGSIDKNPGGLGTYSCILVFGKHEKKLVGHEENSTNSRMELMPILEGLKILKKRCNVRIYSDSQYAINVCSQNYKAKKNLDLVIPIIEEVKKHEVVFIWIKGHNGDKYNELADQLANEERKRIKTSGYKTV